MRAVLALLLSAMLAAGCGQRGPLYLRDRPPPGAQPPQTEPYQPQPYPKERARDDSGAPPAQD